MFPPGKVHSVKVLIIVAVVEGLLRLVVSHHEVVLVLLEAPLLEIQMVMNKLFFLKYSRDTSTSVPAAVFDNIG